MGITSNFTQKSDFESKNNIIIMNLNWSKNYSLYCLKTEI